MTVGELLNRISSRELSEWQLYFEYDPFGGERGDLQAAIVASTVYNMLRGKDAKVANPADFMAKFGPEEQKEQQPWEQQLKIVEMLNIAFGGKDERKLSGQPPTNQAGGKTPGQGEHL